MRKYARPHPKLRINRRLAGLCGQYDETKNVISFGCGCDTEDEVIQTLIHELTHHDIWMFLTLKEISEGGDSMPSYSNDFEQYINWLPEKLSIYLEQLIYSK